VGGHCLELLLQDAWEQVAVLGGREIGTTHRKLVQRVVTSTLQIEEVATSSSKTLVASAYAAHLVCRAAEYGVTVGGPIARHHRRYGQAQTRNGSCLRH
jgi:hypothetical protein